MAVELVVDSLDALDESLKGAYVEKDGKYALDPDKYAEVKATGLKAKTKELLGKLNEAKTGLKRFEKLADLEEDELNALLEQRDKNGQDASAAKANQDRVLKKAAAEKAALEARLAEKERDLKHYKLTVPLKDAAIKAGIIPEYIELATHDPICRFALNDQGKIVYLDEDGDPTTVTPEKFFETTYKELRPHIYKASGAGGSGAHTFNGGKGGGRKTMTRAEWNAMDMKERASIDWKTTAITD